MQGTLGIHYYIVTITRDGGKKRIVRTCSSSAEQALIAVENAEFCPRRIMSVRLATRGEIAETYGQDCGPDALRAHQWAQERNQQETHDSYAVIDHDNCYYVVRRETLAMNDMPDRMQRTADQVSIVYDAGPDELDERYIVFFNEDPYGEALCLSDSLMFSYFGHPERGNHLGKRMKFNDLPEDVQRHIDHKLNWAEEAAYT